MLNIGIAPSLKVVHDRGERIDDKKMLIYKCYMESIRLLSSPLTSCFKAMALVLINNFIISIRFKSLKPLWNILNLFFSIGTIYKNRQLSMKRDAAFLKV